MRFRHRRSNPNSHAAVSALQRRRAGDGPPGGERASFAAGCFWGVEAAFRELTGVLQTSVGYTGGAVAAPTYEQVCSRSTGHAEAVEVWFDPAQISYDELLEGFWRVHNPTARNHQGLDNGDQYRSAIFVHEAQQEAAAMASKNREQAGHTRPIVTQIVPASAFYPAEDYHQRYFEKSGRSACAVTLRQAS